MITPNQIKEKVLSTSSHGYDIDETNAFIDEIAESYSAVYAENKELYRKMEILASKIEEYREEEDSIKSTLLTAQKAANQLTKSSKEKAEKLLSESATSAQKTVMDAKEKAEKLVSEARDYASTLTKEKTDAANEIIGEAEKKANDAINSAKIVAGDIMAKVKEASAELVTKAKEEKEYHENLVSKLKEESKSFKSSLVSLYKLQLEKLTEMMDAPADAEKGKASETLNSIEEDLENIISEIDAAEPVASAEQESKEAEIPYSDGPEEDDAHTEEPQEKAEEGSFELNELQQNSAQDVAENEEIEEIEEIEEPDEDSVDVYSALDAFSNDEITPISNTAQFTEISEEPEMEQIDSANEELPFESFFNVKHTEERTDEKLSLIPPEDFEEEEEDLKFRGFFKKKKDKTNKY